MSTQTRGNRKKHICAASLSAAVLLLCLLPLTLRGQEVRLTIRSIERVETGFLVKGEAAASLLNPEGQVVEHDTIDIIADIQKAPGAVYPVLPDGMVVRKPSTAETNLKKQDRYLTNSEKEGRDTETIVIASLPIRPPKVWERHGGVEGWRSSAPPEVNREFEGIIPLEYGGNIMRIRASLRHVWGGPDAFWPSFSYHHHIPFEGRLEQGASGGMSVGGGTGGSGDRTGGTVQTGGQRRDREERDTREEREEAAGRDPVTPGANRPPSLDLRLSPPAPGEGQDIAITAEASDPEGDPLVFRWILNGTVQGQEGPVLSLGRLVAGTYSAAVEISDGKNPPVSAERTFSVQPQGRPDQTVPCASLPAGIYNLVAKLDESCRSVTGGICVAGGQQAVSLSFQIYSTWAPCQGTSPPDEIGFSIKDVSSGTMLYRLGRKYNMRIEELNGPLNRLRLPPGEYEIIVHGGKNTILTLSYTLQKWGSGQDN
jgi:hypothetical protein